MKILGLVLTCILTHSFQSWFFSKLSYQKPRSTIQVHTRTTYILTFLHYVCIVSWFWDTKISAIVTLLTIEYKAPDKKRKNWPSHERDAPKGTSSWTTKNADALGSSRRRTLTYILEEGGKKTAFQPSGLTHVHKFFFLKPRRLSSPYKYYLLKSLKNLKWKISDLHIWAGLA